MDEDGFDEGESDSLRARSYASRCVFQARLDRYDRSLRLVSALRSCGLLPTMNSNSVGCVAFAACMTGGEDKVDDADTRCGRDRGTRCSMQPPN